MAKIHSLVAPITHVAQPADGIHTIRFNAPRVVQSALAGQFLNVRPDDSMDPLLRRAYSIHRILGDDIELIYNVVGRGSTIIAAKQVGETIDVLGPLGVPFETDGSYDTALLVSGGLGIAPMPFLSDTLERMGKHVINIHGARSKAQIVDDGRLVNVRYSTDDGSMGLHGNVVDVMRETLQEVDAKSVKAFACGPNAMLRALGEYCASVGVRLDVSLECQMACGIGICQGCPVQMVGSEKRYSLVCTHGPNYNYGDILIDSLPLLH